MTNGEIIFCVKPYQTQRLIMVRTFKKWKQKIQMVISGQWLDTRKYNFICTVICLFWEKKNTTVTC